MKAHFHDIATPSDIQVHVGKNLFAGRKANVEIQPGFQNMTVSATGIPSSGSEWLYRVML